MTEAHQVTLDALCGMSQRAYALEVALRALVAAVELEDNPSDQGLSRYSPEMLAAKHLLKLP